MDKRTQDFNALQATLQTGNIAGAQGAFASFLQDVQTVASASGPNSLFAPGSAANKDLATLGGALRASDLSTARTAFASLQMDLHNAAPHTAISANHVHRPLSQVDISKNSAVPLPTISANQLATTIGSVLNQKA